MSSENSQTLFPPIRRGIEEALAEIFNENRHADKIVDNYFKHNRKWGSRDRKQFAEVVYDCVRHWRRLGVLAGQKYFDRGMMTAGASGEGANVPVEPLTADQIKNRVEVYLVAKAAGQDLSKPNAKMTRAEAESIPDWLDQMGSAEFDHAWDETIHWLNKPAEQYLRANTLKTSAKDLVKQLATEDIEAEYVEVNHDATWIHKYNGAAKLLKRKNVFTTKAFENGLFEMQDLGSQLISLFLQPQPGHRVVDACAGAGGKALHIAQLMGNSGKIIALDVHQWKLDELRKRSSRAGVDIIETRLIEGSKTIKRLEATADRLLLDVPCSGLGVLRRYPDTKWKMNPETIKDLLQQQQEILSSYSKVLKVGGVLVYSTCSIFDQENFLQIEQFLADQKEAFILEGELTILPQDINSDGFYMARLKRMS